MVISYLNIVLKMTICRLKMLLLSSYINQRISADVIQTLYYSLYLLDNGYQVIVADHYIFTEYPIFYLLS